MSKSLPVKEVCKSYDEIHDGKTMNILGDERQIGEKSSKNILVQYSPNR